MSNGSTSVDDRKLIVTVTSPTGALITFRNVTQEEFGEWLETECIQRHVSDSTIVIFLGPGFILNARYEAVG